MEQSVIEDCEATLHTDEVAFMRVSLICLSECYELSVLKSSSLTVRLMLDEIA